MGYHFLFFIYHFLIKIFLSRLHYNTYNINLFIFLIHLCLSGIYSIYTEKFKNAYWIILLTIKFIKNKKKENDKKCKICFIAKSVF